MLTAEQLEIIGSTYGATRFYGFASRLCHAWTAEISLEEFKELWGDSEGIDKLVRERQGEIESWRRGITAPTFVDGNAVHGTLTGRTSIVVKPSGETTLEISRPSGPVLRGTIPAGWANGGLVVEFVDAEKLHDRHVEALVDAARYARSYIEGGPGGLYRLAKPDEQP